MKAKFKHSRRVVRGFRTYSRFAGWLMLVVGLCSSLGWVARIAITPDWGGRDMRLTAALGFVLSGLALAGAGRRKGTGLWLGSLLCCMVIALGSDALIEHSVGNYRGLADWLDAAHGDGRTPALMAKLAAIAFMLMGGQGLLILHGRALVLRELLGLGVLSIAMASMASFAFVLAQHGEGLFDQLPILTGILLLLGALGWMSAAPTTGLTRISTAATLGGVFARSLLLPALLLPLAYTFVFKMLETRFGVPQIVASTLGAMFTGGTVAWMIWLVAALLDRSERQQEASILLRDEVDTDSLTGLGNRRKFDAAIEGLLRDYRQEQVPFSLLLLDVDHFKAYNDAYGHQAGDVALREIGRLLRNALRPQDLAVRYGGEEFALLIHGARMPLVPVIAERVLQAIRANSWPLQPLTASIGGAEVCDADSAVSLLQRADAALYGAKNKGRDRFEVMGYAECIASRGKPPFPRARAWEPASPGCRAGAA